MYNEQLETLIDAALADGVLTEKEKQILFKKAQTMGIDLDEFEMVLDARLVKLQKAEQEKAASSAPKSNKFGDVKKCPACGAIVQSYQGKCPECGYAFEGIEANSVAKELSKQLQLAKDQNQMIKVIESFPIPMDKAVLIDFISWLKPQCLDVKNPLAKSYGKKYEECIQKARITFANDKELSPLISEYDSVKKQIKKAKVLEVLKRLSKKWWFWVLLGVLIILIVSSISGSISDKRQDKAAAAIRNNDLTTAYTIMMKDGEVKDKVCPSFVQKCLELNEVGMAESFYSSLDSWNRDRVNKYIYDYCMQNKDYEKAEKYTDFYDHYSPNSYSYDEEHYAFIVDVVTSMCKDGKKKEAKNYADCLIEKYEWKEQSYFHDVKEYKEYKYTKPNVTKSINGLLGKY